MATPWSALDIPDAAFSVDALADAIDEKKAERGLSWKAVALEINRAEERTITSRPINTSTITGLRGRPYGVEGDGVLQMLIWLERTPESFVPGHPGADHPDARLPRPKNNEILRFDVPKIYTLLDAQRKTSGMSWADAAREIGGLFSADSLKKMGQNSRAGFPGVMRLSRWLHVPAASLTRISNF